MLQKSQPVIIQKTTKAPSSNRLSAAERGLLQFAVIDEEDKALQVACGHGALLNELAMRYRCTVCGTTNDIDKLRYARKTLSDADVIFAQPSDIPWHDESFSVVLCEMSLSDITNSKLLLKEIFRTLKPGGQALISLPWYPAPLSALINYFDGARRFFSKLDAIAALESTGFESVTWHSNEWGSSVVIGWKAKYQYS